MIYLFSFFHTEGGKVQDAHVCDNKQLSIFHSHVSIHHFAGIVCSVIKVLQVSLHLTQSAPHSQQVDVSVSQNWFCFLYAFPADFYHLEKKEKA